MSAPRTAARVAHPPPRFTTGSLLRHILVMTGAGGVGLGAIFLGDLANIAFLSWLGDEAIVAAVGYASSILFFTTSIGIGLSIAATTLVSRALGARRRSRARRLSANAHVATLLIAVLASLIVWFAVPSLLSLLGAAGRTHDLAVRYLLIQVPAVPAMCLAITSSAVLRSLGDARRAMHVTLSGALANIALDPVFIFWLGLGLDGAAIASFLARLVFMAVGLYGVVWVHGLMARPRLRPFLSDLPAIGAIATPAILANVATPVSNGYVTGAIAAFGDGAVAGWAILGRVMPVAFGALYALSGSVGPIIGQNMGARLGQRMQETFLLSLAVTAGFSLAAWLLLALSAGELSRFFHAEGDAQALIMLFCQWLAPLFAFLGFLFVANAVFNTLGRPHYSTALNWGRATLGTIPFVHAGGMMAGAEGVLAGHMIGAMAFGLLAVWICQGTIEQVRSGMKQAG